MNVYSFIIFCLTFGVANVNANPNQVQWTTTVTNVVDGLPLKATPAPIVQSPNGHAPEHLYASISYGEEVYPVGESLYKGIIHFQAKHPEYFQEVTKIALLFDEQLYIHDTHDIPQILIDGSSWSSEFIFRAGEDGCMSEGKQIQIEFAYGAIDVTSVDYLLREVPALMFKVIFQSFVLIKENHQHH